MALCLSELTTEELGSLTIDELGELEVTCIIVDLDPDDPVVGDAPGINENHAVVGFQGLRPYFSKDISHIGNLGTQTPRINLDLDLN